MAKQSRSTKKTKGRSKKMASAKSSSPPPNAVRNAYPGHTQLSSVGQVNPLQSSLEVSPLSSTSASASADVSRNDNDKSATSSLKQASACSAPSMSTNCSYTLCLCIGSNDLHECTFQGCTRKLHVPCQIMHRHGKCKETGYLPPNRCQAHEDDHLSSRKSNNLPSMTIEDACSMETNPSHRKEMSPEAEAEAEDTPSQNSSDSECDMIPRKLAHSMEEAASTQASSEPPTATDPLSQGGGGNMMEVEASSDSTTPPPLPLTSSFLLDYGRKVTPEEDVMLAYPMRSTPRLYANRKGSEYERYKHENGEILIKHPSNESLVVTQGSFSRLQPRDWLDDEVINFYCSGILPHEAPGVHSYRSFFWTKIIRFDSDQFVDDDDEFYKFERVQNWHRAFARKCNIASIFDLKFLFLPINIKNTHWCFIMVDMALKQIGLWDFFGCNENNRGYLFVAQRYLYDVSVDLVGEDATGTYEEWTRVWSIYDHSEESPRQRDGYSCGIFTMLSMYCLATGIELTPFTFTQQDIYDHRIRMRFALLLWNHRLPSASNTSRYATTTTPPTPTLPALAPRKESTAASVAVLPAAKQESMSETAGNRSKGGRPKNSTNAAKLARERARKKAANWVVSGYAQEKHAKEEENKHSVKRVRVAAGFRASLVEQAKGLFQIEDKDFDVPLATIENRIKADRLEVWHPGDVPPVKEVEVVLVSMIILAGELKCPLSVGDIITLANNLIEDTPVAEKLIAWKRRKGMAVDPDHPLLGTSWQRGFFARNTELLNTQKGIKYAKRREEQCNFQSFSRMYDNVDVEKGIIQSGNGVRLDKAVHMDAEGNIVADSSAAFGWPVTLEFTRPENCFVMDETGSNTNGAADKPKGGEKKVVGRGQKAQEVTGTKDCHFTVVPVNNLLGDLVLVTIIFPGETFRPSWGIGEDPFVVDIPGEDQSASIGPGKRYPGLSVFTVNGKEVPIYFAASKSASMTATILKGMFQKMDELGITKRGTDKDGKAYFPLMIFDGHVSRFGLIFLEYVCALLSRWYAVLGVPYGTNFWQMHDDDCQNGHYSMTLYEAKSEFITKKRVIGLPAEIRKQEIVIVAKSAIESSFNDPTKAKRALSKRGWYPFNRATLDEPDILRTAPQEVQQERQAILALRGVSGSSTGRSTTVVTSRTDLLSEGSGLIAASTQEQGDAAALIASTTSILNWGNSVTAQNILDLATASQARQAGREKKEAEQRTRQSLRETYNDKSKRLTSGLVFAHGDGVLNNDLLEATKTRAAANEEAAVATANNKKKKLLKMKEQVESVRRDIVSRIPNVTSEKNLDNQQLSDLGVKKLTILVKYKKVKKDGKMPTNKANLITLLRDIWNRPSPNPSPYNSDVDEEDDADGIPMDDADGIPMDDEAMRHYLDANRVVNGGGGDGNSSNSDDDDDGEE